MKSTSSIVLLLLLFLTACSGKGSALVGNWQAEKVHVSFDEAHSTPQLVRETGKIEKRNRIAVTSDSLLTLTNGTDTLFHGRFIADRQGHIQLRQGLVADWNGEMLVTQEETSLGVITVTYSKR